MLRDRRRRKKRTKKWENSMLLKEEEGAPSPPKWEKIHVLHTTGCCRGSFGGEFGLPVHVFGRGGGGGRREREVASKSCQCANLKSWREGESRGWNPTRLMVFLLVEGGEEVERETKEASKSRALFGFTFCACVSLLFLFFATAREIVRGGGGGGGGGGESCCCYYKRNKKEEEGEGRILAC